MQARQALYQTTEQSRTLFLLLLWDKVPVIPQADLQLLIFLPQPPKRLGLDLHRQAQQELYFNLFYYVIHQILLSQIAGKHPLSRTPTKKRQYLSIK